MVRIAKPSSGFKIFAENEASGERTLYGQTATSDDLSSAFTAEYQRGWGIVTSNDAPTKQDFNALGFTLSKCLKYLEQEGIPLWIPSIQNYANTFKSYNGKIFACKADHSGVSTTPQNDTTHWTLVGGDLNAIKNDLQLQITTLENSLNGVSTTVAGHTSDLSGLKNTVAGHTATLGQHTTDLSSVKGQLSNHSGTLGTHTSTLSGHTSQLGQHTSDIAGLTKAVQDLKNASSAGDDIFRALHATSAISSICSNFDRIMNMSTQDLRRKSDDVVVHEWKNIGTYQGGEGKPSGILQFFDSRKIVFIGLNDARYPFGSTGLPVYVFDGFATEFDTKNHEAYSHKGQVILFYRGTKKINTVFKTIEDLPQDNTKANYEQNRDLCVQECVDFLQNTWVYVALYGGLVVMNVADNPGGFVKIANLASFVIDQSKMFSDAIFQKNYNNHNNTSYFYHNFYTNALAMSCSIYYFFKNYGVHHPQNVPIWFKSEAYNYTGSAVSYPNFFSLKAEDALRQMLLWIYGVLTAKIMPSFFREDIRPRHDWIKNYFSTAMGNLSSGGLSSGGILRLSHAGKDYDTLRRGDNNLINYFSVQESFYQMHVRFSKF